MTRSRMRATIYGAAAGGLVGLALLVFWTGRNALGSVDGVLLSGVMRARAMFEVSSGGLYLTIVISGALGGLAIASIVYALGREAEPESPRFPLRFLLPAAAVTAAILTYAAVRASLGIAADITAGVVTISVFRMLITALLSGAIAGGITAGAVDALARPAFLGLEGEAWPSSMGAVMKEMMRAVGAPTVAIVVVAAFAIGLSQVLLALHGPASVAAFSIVGALVLGGASLLAYRPWENAGR